MAIVITIIDLTSRRRGLLRQNGLIEFIILLKLLILLSLPCGIQRESEEDIWYHEKEIVLNSKEIAKIYS